MEEKWRERLSSALDKSGMNMKDLSLKAGQNETFVRDVLKRNRTPTIKGFQALAEALEMSVSALLGEEPVHHKITEQPAMVPIIGKVGANPDGKVIYGEGQPSFTDKAPIPPGGTAKAVALEVEGHSMRGYADNGSLIYFEDQRQQPSSDMMNEVVVVQIDTGEVLVKRLLRGSEPGLYDLESLAGPMRRDVKLDWAAHITAIVPPHTARKVIVRE